VVFAGVSGKYLIAAYPLGFNISEPNPHISPSQLNPDQWRSSTFLFDVFKIAGNGEPVLIQKAQGLKASVVGECFAREFPR
jgi:hypothetical protein